VSSFRPEEGSRWEGRQAVPTPPRDYDWQGLLRCEPCGGWTLHTGIHADIRVLWFLFLLVSFGWIWAPRRPRWCVLCERCGASRGVDESEDERLRSEAEHLFQGYLQHGGRAGIDGKSLADEDVLNRARAEWARGPMTVQEAEEELRRGSR